MVSTSFSLSTSFLAPKLPNVSMTPSPAATLRSCPLPRVSAAYATAERTSCSYIASQTSSLYEILGIHMGATCQEIKAAYRRLARVSHPDVASNGQKHTSADAFMRIHAAYATLSDPEKRADYDRKLFRRRRPMSSPFAMSAGSKSASGFSGYTRRTWETDQCW